MKKVFILISILFLTGCTATYNLTISYDGMTEKIDFITSKDEIDADFLTEMKDNKISASNSSEIEAYYDISSSLNKENTKLSLRHYYTYEDFVDSARIRDCYNDFIFAKTSFGYSLMTSNEFLCDNYMYNYLSNVEIKITTNYISLENNADKVDGDTYIWYVNESNKQNKPLILKLEESTLINNKKSNIFVKTLIICVTIFIGLVGFIILLIKLQGKRANKM